MKNRKPISIAIVTADLVGWGEPTESAASIAGIAQTFAANGDSVTLLWVPGPEEIDEDEVERLTNYYYDKFLIKLEILTSSRSLLPILWNNSKQSVAVYHYLRERPFDTVLFQLEGGLAYYSLLAVETGQFDPDFKIGIVAHYSVSWLGKAGRFFMRDLGDVTVDHMERYCAEAAHHLICVSDAFLEWLKASGWKLCEDVMVLPPILPGEWRLSSPSAVSNSVEAAASEIVVLAGPEFRDGLTLFCDAIDKLAKSESALTKVTTFGPFGKILGEHTGGMLLRRARRWPFELQILPRMSVRESLDYLIDRQALAVVPSFESATGHWVSACLDAGVPFIATHAGANDELIMDEDAARCLAECDAQSLANKIVTALAGQAPARQLGSPGSRAQAWISSIDRILKPTPTSDAGKSDGGTPLVSVIMVHHNRPQYLLQAIKAVENQTYKKLELILVDDGSTLPEAIDLLKRLEPEFNKKNWKIIRQENKYLGAARNAGVRASKGKRILFVDDDNALFPYAVESYVRAMDKSNADICTSFQKLFYEQFIPDNLESGYIQYIPPGGSLDLGLIHDSFGDANAMIRRSVFKKIGYQIEDYGYTAQDWEFYTRATLAGLKLRIIPEPLYWYRSDSQGMYRTSHWYDNRLPILKAFKDHNYRGLDGIYEILLSQNVSKSEIEGYYENLLYSVSDERYIELCQLSPNSDEALELLAEIAASEGRSDTALVLLGRIRVESFSKVVVEKLFRSPQADNAQHEFGTGFVNERWYGHEDLRQMHAGSTGSIDQKPMSYVEEPDRIFLQARDGAISIAVLPTGCPAGCVGAAVTVSLDQALTVPAEFMVLAAPSHLDPIVAVQGAPQGASDGGSGWCRVSHPYEARRIEASLSIPSAQPRNLIFAVREKEPEAGPVLGCFAGSMVRVALGDKNARRQRVGPPPSKLRAREWTEAERTSARLITNYPSELPLLLLPPREEGIFLRPCADGPVVASLDYAFPPLTRRLLGRAEIAHEEASPFEFAMALTMPSEPVIWRGEKPDNCIAFSNWVRVEETFKLHDLELYVPELLKTHLAVNLAIRLPDGSKSKPSNAYWRQLIFAWDE